MSLPLPDPALRASVVVPARDEEALIGACLRALAAQQRLSPEEYEVLLVLDRCTDGTEDRARAVAREHPGLRLNLLYGPGRGAGHARRMGMEEACSRLISLGRPEGLISSTDADTVVAPDWLHLQLEASERGAQAIGGRIELADNGSSLPADVERWHREQGRMRHLELLSGSGEDTARTEHWQFSGASLSLTAETYREVGGLEPREALEDEYLERVLRQRSIPIERPLAVRVSTSPRLVGRASQGLARDLALAQASLDSRAPAADPDPEEAYSMMAAFCSRTTTGQSREAYAPGPLVLPKPGSTPGFESRRVVLEERPALASLLPQTGNGDRATL